MISEPLVSIVVPVFNAGRLISDFIRSIKKQSYSYWELILVDDGSSDSTIEFIRCEMNFDQRIKLLFRKQEPKGSLTCRNIGMKSARGAYIIHFDADDLVLPFCLEQRVSFMEKNKHLEFAIFPGASFYSDEKGNNVVVGHRWGRKRKADDLVSFLMNDYPFSVWNCIYRSSVFINQLWDENVKIYTDFSYIVPILLNGHNYAYSSLSNEDYLYRVNQKNAMTSSFISEEKFESTMYLFEKIHCLIFQSPNYKVYKKSFKRYFIVQFERILNNSDENKRKRFCLFYDRFYGRDIRMNVLAFVGVVSSRMNAGKKRKIIRLFVSLLYRPDFFVKWLFSKI